MIQDRSFRGLVLWAQRKVYSLIAAIVFALITFYALFKLPFLFPPRQRLWSASFAFGFNNGISVISLAALLGLAACVLIWLGYNREPPIRFPLEIHPYDRRSVKVALGLLALMYAGLTFGMYVYYERSAPWLMWEVRHFLHRTDLMDIYGLRAYSQFQAEYGPLLTHTPLYVHSILKGLGVSIDQAYFTSYYLLNLGGLACIYYLFSRAAMMSSARAVAFVAVAIAGFGMWMGLNGVILRYLCPFASLLFGHRALVRMRSSSKVSFCLSGTAVVLVLLGLNILLSPEAAAAFVVAWFAQAVLMLRSDARVLAVSVLATVSASALSWALLPPEYYSSLLRFAEGANNLPLLPAAHLLLFTVTMFLIVPALLAAAVRSRGSSAEISGGFGILCIAMAPGALGRCDPPHVLFFSMGASILAMIWLANISRWAFAAYIAVYCAVFVALMQVINLQVFYHVAPRSLVSPRFISQLAANLAGGSGTEHPSSATLASLARYSRIGLPFATFGDPVVERYVLQHGQLQPEYYISVVGVYTEDALQRKLRDIKGTEYLLLPSSTVSGTARDACAEYLISLREWFMYPARLPCVANALDPGASILNFVESNYSPVEKIGSSVVMRRISNPGATAEGK